MPELRNQYLDQEPQGEALAPPIDVRTIARSLIRHRWVAGGWFLAGAVLAVATGLVFGSRTYQADTVLLHRPLAGSLSNATGAQYDSLPLTTQLNLVKVRSNVAATREILGLPVSLERLAAAVEVTVEKNTSLMVVSAQWSDPERAAEIANTLRNVFLRNQVGLRYREEMELLNLIHRSALEEHDRIKAQLDNIDRITENLESKIRMEMLNSPESEGLGNINVRAERIRDAIYDDRRHRANTALLAQREVEFERASGLFDRGVITEAELGEARGALEHQRALTDETDESRRWREELERLQDAVIPGDRHTSPSVPLLEQVMRRAISVEFQRVEAEERVAQVARLQALLRMRMATLDSTDLRMQNDGSPPAWMADSQFRIITAAVVPVFPQGGNRKLVAIGVFVFIGLVGTGGKLASELLSPTLRSGPEAEVKTGVPVLATLPRIDDGAALPHDQLTAVRYRLLAERLRAMTPPGGVKILVVSPRHGEGKTTVAALLANALLEREESVLVIDAAVDPEECCFGRGVGTGTEVPGLVSRFLQKSNPEPEERRSLEHLLAATNAGLASLVDETTSPRLSGTHLDDRIKKLATGFDSVVIDGPPVIPYADAEELASRVDVVVVVARSPLTLKTDLQLALRRLTDAGAKVAGIALNETDHLFLDLE